MAAAYAQNKQKNAHASEEDEDELHDNEDKDTKKDAKKTAAHSNAHDKGTRSRPKRGQKLTSDDGQKRQRKLTDYK